MPRSLAGQGRSPDRGRWFRCKLLARGSSASQGYTQTGEHTDIEPFVIEMPKIAPVRLVLQCGLQDTRLFAVTSQLYIWEYVHVRTTERFALVMASKVALTVQAFP